MIKRPLLLIVDAMSQVFRAYYAVRGLSNNQGVPTNATYGFLLMLNRVLEKFSPDYIVMVWDSSEPTPRHLRYPAYKATRERMPADLGEQIPYIKRFCEAMRVQMVEVSGQEADDVIGTVARRAKAERIKPVIVTLDKDMMQLVDEDTCVLNTSKDDLIVGPDEVKELFGVTPGQIPDLLGLWGDASDNVPGAPGIGEKGARSLIERFGSLEAAIDRAEEVSAKRQRESLIGNREQILLSKELVTIDTEVEVDLDWESLRTRPPDDGEFIALLRELDFTSLLKEHLATGETSTEVEIVQTEDVSAIGDRFAFSLSGDRILVWDGEGPIADLPIAPAGTTLLTDNARLKITHDLKTALSALEEKGVGLAPP